jgi:acyl-CoA thioesterase I
MHFHERAENGKMPARALRICLTTITALRLATPALARPIRIVAFGDSATYGWLVAREHAYPAQLQQVLRAKGYDVLVKNEGVPGGTAAEALRHLDDAIAPGTDIVFLEFGTNDLRARVPAKRMRTTLGEIVRTLRKRGIAVLLIGLGNLNLSDVARANDVPYAQWKLPPGKYRARDHVHFNAQGYAIVIRRMLPQIERVIGQISAR